ncbi:hypothetical protein H4S07_006261, partial [Coemansia furcata]
MILIYIVRFTYAALTCTALAFALAPWTREAFVKYGRTRSQCETAAKGADTTGAGAGSSGGSIFSTALRMYTSWTVSKNLFSQFYCVGTIIGGLLTIDTIAWCNSHFAPELSATGLRFFVHRYIALEQWLSGSTPSELPIPPPSKLAALALTLFTIHVLIRLKECVYDQPLTDAQMHIGQYAVGVVFYV